MFKPLLSIPRVGKAALLATAALLGACSDNDALPNDHDHAETSAGRLVIGKADGANSKAIVYDLGERKTAAELPLRYEPTAIYASPGRRYAVILQAAQGAVNFVDGGIYTHLDHVDIEPPSLLGFERTGAKPAHYREHGTLAALFYDGEGSSNAKIDVLSDDSLARGALEATQSLPAPVHGIAEPRGDHLLSIDYTAEEHAAAATRTAVRLYERHNDHYHAEQRFDTPCLNLHGGASNASASAFGCTDGVLVVAQNGASFSDFKIATDKRVTQVAGHLDVAHFAAFASDGTLYAIDPAARTAAAVDWSAGATTAAGVPVNRSQHAFDAHARHLLILDNTGILHVLEAADFSRRGGVKVLESVVAGAAAPRLAVSASEDRVFINDADGRAIVVVDLDSLAVVDHVDLDFTPVGVTWVGAAGADGHAH